MSGNKTMKLHLPELVGRGGIRNFHLEQFDGDPEDVFPGRFWFNLGRGRIRYAYTETPEDVNVKIGTVDDSVAAAQLVAQVHGLGYNQLGPVVKDQLEFMELGRRFADAVENDDLFPWSFASGPVSVMLDDMRATVTEPIELNLEPGDLITFNSESGWKSPAELVELERRLGDGDLIWVRDHRQDGALEFWQVLIINVQPHTGIAAVLGIYPLFEQRILQVLDGYRYIYTADQPLTQHDVIPPEIGFIAPSETLAHLNITVWMLDEELGQWRMDSSAVAVDDVMGSVTVTLTEPTRVVAIVENMEAKSGLIIIDGLPDFSDQPT